MSQSVQNAKNLKILRVAVGSPKVIEEYGCFWESVSELERLEELQLELKFFRTSKVNLQNVCLVKRLTKVKELVLLLENKRNNEDFG